MFVGRHFAGSTDCLAIGFFSENFQELRFLAVKQSFLRKGEFLLPEVIL